MRSELDRAIRNGDLNEVKALLENCAEPIDALLKYRDHPYKRGSMLNTAVETGNVELVRYLVVDRGADPNLHDERYPNNPLRRCERALHVACHGDNGGLPPGVEVVRLLLEHGASPHVRDRNGRTPLMTVCEYSSCLSPAPAIGREAIEVARLLIESGSDVNAKSDTIYFGRTPLHTVCRFIRGDLDRRPSGWSAADRFELAQLLLEHGAEDSATSFNTSPLYDACDSESVDLVKLLLDRGFEMDAICMDGHTPLWNACRGDRLPIIKLLLMRGANIYAAGKTSSRCSPLLEVTHRWGAYGSDTPASRKRRVATKALMRSFFALWVRLYVAGPSASHPRRSEAIADWGAHVASFLI